MTIMSIEQAIAHFKAVVEKLPGEARAELGDIEIRITHDWVGYTVSAGIGAILASAVWLIFR